MKTKAIIAFAEIPKLTDQWWTGTPTDDPSIVWTVWQKGSYYLWGANSGNYQIGTIGSLIGGGGMASVSRGPSRGRHHPHYVGVITMDANEMPKNDAVFSSLAALTKDPKNTIVIPIYNTAHNGTPEYKFSLGTGIAGGQPHWDTIQKYILQHIVDLSTACDVTIPKGVYWPDCRKPRPYKKYPITCIDDIKKIIADVL